MAEMYYYILSMVPIAFNYGYILLMEIPMLYLLRFFLNWMIFPVILVLINFFRVKSGKIRPLGSFLVSFFVMAMCYGSVYILHYASTDMPFEMFGIVALFLVNMYFFMPFAVIAVMDLAFVIFRPKRKKKPVKKSARQAQIRQAAGQVQNNGLPRSGSGRGSAAVNAAKRSSTVRKNTTKNNTRKR